MFSGAASAVVDLNATGGGVGTNAYASENIVAGGTIILNVGNILDITNDLGFGIADDDQRFLRYDLPAGVTFSAAIGAGNILITAGAGTGTFTVAEGGSLTDSHVIFALTATANIAVTDEVTFFLPGIVTSNQNAVTITYNQHETGDQAQTPQTNSLATSNAALITFSPALSLVCSANGASDNIDVTTGSVSFDTSNNASPRQTDLGTFQIALAATPLLTLAGVPVTIATILNSAVITATASNGWSAIDSLTTSGGGAATFVLSGADFVTTPAIAAPAGFGVATTFTAGVPAANATPIESSTVTLNVATTANATYSAATTTGACTLGAMTKNGSHDRLTFALTPNGSFKNFVRISNPSSTDGNVYLTVTDDAGVKSMFPLSAVIHKGTALAPGLLKGASTPLLDINEIAAAAVIANAALSTEHKLRVDVDAEFGANGSKLVGVSVPSTVLPTTPSAVINTAVIIGGLNALPAAVSNTLSSATIMESETAVNIQAFAMSKDRNSFFMLQKD